MGGAALEGTSILALDPALMIPTFTLVGALLLGAVVVAFVRRWQQTHRSLGPSASDQLAEFRQLYERGTISKEEFDRLRAVLGGEIRKQIDLPNRSPDPGKPSGETSPKNAEVPPPTDTGGPSSEGIRPQ